MSYKKGLSKTQFKNTMRMFWTERWKYQRTVEQWVDSLSIEDGDYWTSGPSKYNLKLIPYGKKSLDLLSSAIDKLVLERKILKQQGVRMKEMIASPDKENALLAIQIMHGLKPRKFKK